MKNPGSVYFAGSGSCGHAGMLFDLLHLVIFYCSVSRYSSSQQKRSTRL